jgi:hypothetical protein
LLGCARNDGNDGHNPKGVLPDGTSGFVLSKNLFLRKQPHAQ